MELFWARLAAGYLAGAKIEFSSTSAAAMTSAKRDGRSAVWWKRASARSAATRASLLLSLCQQRMGKHRLRKGANLQRSRYISISLSRLSELFTKSF